MIEYESLKLVNQPLAAELKEAFNRVLDSGWYILGNEVKQFLENCDLGGFTFPIGNRMPLGLQDVQGLPHQVHRPQSVVETGMQSPGIDVFSHTQLLDSA